MHDAMIFYLFPSPLKIDPPPCPILLWLCAHSCAPSPNVTWGSGGDDGGGDGGVSKNDNDNNNEDGHDDADDKADNAAIAAEGEDDECCRHQSI